MTAQHSNEPAIYMAMELSSKQWKLRFGDCKKVYNKTLPARDLEGLAQTSLASPRNEGDAIAAKLLRLRGLGPVGAWLLAKEVSVWRKFQNRRQVGSVAGLTGTPHSSDTSSRDQGISKAGNRQPDGVPRTDPPGKPRGWTVVQDQYSHCAQHRGGRGIKRVPARQVTFPTSAFGVLSSAFSVQRSASGGSYRRPSVPISQ